MRKEDFFKQAIAAGKSKEEAKAVFDRIVAAGGFDDDKPEVGNSTTVSQPENTPLESTPYDKYGTVGALFPATARQEALGNKRGLTRAVATVGDAFSLLPRGASAVGAGFGSLQGGKRLPEAYDDAMRELQKTKSDEKGVLGVVQNIGLDPTTWVPGTQVVKGAKLLPTIGKAVWRPAVEGGASAAYQQLAEGRIDPGRVAAQTVLGAVTGGGMVVAGKGISKGVSAIRGAKKAIPAPVVARPIEAVSFDDINKGKAGPILQPTGEVVSTGKIKQPGLMWNKDLSEAETRIMAESRAPKTIPFTEYAKQAKSAKSDLRALNPGQKAATNATEAFKKIDSIRKAAGAQIDAAMEAAPDAKIDISDVKQRYYELVNKQLGIQKSVDGAEDAFSLVSDPSALPIHKDIIQTLENIPDVLDVQTAQRLKQNIRSKLQYDATGQLRPKNSRMSAIQKEISSLVDSKLDAQLGPAYTEANSLYGEAAKLEDAFSRALGAEFTPGSGLTKHGASIMKRALQSNADSNTGDIFRAVKKLTGGEYDLFQDAAYANIAMRLSGDANQVRKASSFGTIMDAGRGGSGGDIISGIEKGVKVMGAGREKLTGGQLARIEKWYRKQHGLEAVQEVLNEAKQPKKNLGTIADALKPLKNERGAVGSEAVKTDNFKNWFGDWEKAPDKASKVVDESGKPLRVYSGHSNSNLYGSKFEPKKATSGAFYATEDPAIASNYSTGKMGVKENYEGGSEYVFAAKNGKYTKKLHQIELTPEQIQKLDALKSDPNHELADMDAYIKSNKNYDKDVRRWSYSGGSKNLKNIFEFYDQNGYTIPSYEHDPTGLKKQVELYGNSRFDDLLDNLDLKWDSYSQNKAGVMPIYLDIKNPIDASKPFPPRLLEALKSASKYERVQPAQYGAGSTQWTKDYPMKQWINDIENGDEYWTTQIPKKALPILKAFGYDGIKELGNKGAADFADRQVNWIVFEPGQIKSATGNSGKFDPKVPDIRGSGAVPILAGTAAAGIGGLTAYEKAKELKNKKKKNYGTVADAVTKRSK